MKIGQILGVNLITVLMFGLSVGIYFLFGFFPFAVMLGVSLVYAIAANLWVLSTDQRNDENRLRLWQQYFPESYALLHRSRASLMMRNDAISQIRDAAVKKAYQQATIEVEEDYRRSLEFLETYDFVNNPGDPSGRLKSFAAHAETTVSDFNDFIDDARDADGGVGDELDSHIRTLKRELAAMPDGDPDRRGLVNVIDRLEKISDILHENPDSAGGFRRLINYYLPTLETLLAKRSDMVRAGVFTDPSRGDGAPAASPANEKAAAAREEISEALSSMPQALDQMIASVYEGEAVDIIAEKGVMDDFLRQDSLRGDRV